MKTSFSSGESLAVSAFRATVLSFLGGDLTRRFEEALCGDAREGRETGSVAALLGFAGELRRGAVAIEEAVRRWLLAHYTEDQALALVAFASAVRRYGSLFAGSLGASVAPAVAAA